MAERTREGSSSSESETVASRRLRRSTRKPSLNRYAVIQGKPRNTEIHCDACSRESSQDSRATKNRRGQPCTHHARIRTRCQPARSPLVTKLYDPQERTKAASRARQIVDSDRSWSVPLRPRKASMTPPPLNVTIESLWDGVGGSPQPRDLSPSTASANTDDLLECDAEAMELRAQIAHTQRDRNEFGRRLQELEIKMRLVRAEMDDLRGRQRDREEKVTEYTRRRWQ